MSVQRFCHHCGKEVTVGSKFCSGCGTNLLSLASAPPAPQPTQPRVPRETFEPAFVADGDEDDKDAYLDRMTHLEVRIKSLQVSVVKDRPQLDTVGDVAKLGALAGQAEPVILERSQPYLNVDTKQFQQEFQKEAGTFRHDEK